MVIEKFKRARGGWYVILCAFDFYKLIVILPDVFSENGLPRVEVPFVLESGCRFLQIYVQVYDHVMI